MKKKIAALLLCAVLSATSFPVTGMAGEFNAASEDVSQETPDPEITPTVKPARTPKVTASVVKGLEKPLKFYPGQFYEFKVIGAGTDNKSPVKGAVRWIPLYWSMSSVGDRYNSVWKIGSPVGISTGASYTMYIFFKQQVYNGKLWIDTETVKSMRTTFKSADLSSSKLPIPSLTSVSNKSKGIVFKWNKVTGCSGYMIYRKTGSGKWTKLATVKGSSTLSYTDRTAKSGNTYTYTVKAYKDSQQGSYNTIGLKITRLTAPTLSSLTNTKSGRTNVKWKKVTAASGYQVQYSTSKNFTNSKRISTGNSSSTALSGLKKGKTYYIRVRACKKSNGITSYSPWSNTKSIKIKK